MQLFSVELFAPPPEMLARFPLTVQLISALASAAPPEACEKFAVSAEFFTVQLFTAPPPLLAEFSDKTQPRNSAPCAPPPDTAVLPVMVELRIVPPSIPPPKLKATFPTMTQLETIVFADSQRTPPPLCSRLTAPPFSVAPFAR